MTNKNDHSNPFVHEPMTVITYCTEEVSRQGHDIRAWDGVQRTAWMLNAWAYALAQQQAGREPDIHDLEAIGSLVEPHKNHNGFRTVNVWVGTRPCPPPHELHTRLTTLYAQDTLTPLDFYRQLLEIHPFVDGNGRTGKIILNWLNDTLLRPIFPPNDFWGRPIRNP